MAIICPDHRLLFIMVPGTGCSVIGNLLQSDFGGEWLPEQDLIEHGRLVQGRKHNTVDQLLKSGHLTPADCRDLTVFATVRNPFDRYVTYYQRLVGEWTDGYFAWSLRDIERERPNLSESQYRDRLAYRERMIRRKRRRQDIIRRAGFNNWLKFSLLRWRMNRGSERSRIDYVFPMLTGVKTAIRYEQLEAGLKEVLRHAGIDKPVSLPRKNITPGKRHYTDYYSRSTRQLAESMLRRELSQFGYSFEGPTSQDALIQLAD